MKHNRLKWNQIKSPAVLPGIVTLFFLLMLMFFINIHSISHLFNRESYDMVTATVNRPATDKFFLLFPKVELSYRYQGQTYTETSFFLLEPLFGLSAEQGTELALYVNRYAPNHSLIKVKFFHNIINWLLPVLIVICLIQLVRRIRTCQADKKKEALADETKME